MSGIGPAPLICDSFCYGTLLDMKRVAFATILIALVAGVLAPQVYATDARQATTPQPAALSSRVDYPTPTPRAADAPVRVGIQVGHWKADELPEELERLRTSTGAFSAGLSEATVNLDVARRIARLLEAQGVIVDVLPATVPPAYDADAFVALHADGSRSPGARGYKIAPPWRTSRAAAALRDAIYATYGAATGMPTSDAITINMRGYYAFSYRRHTHAVARTTPAVIVEMGYLTNATDRSIMTRRADDVASGIARGILDYLNARDARDGAALVPVDYRIHRPIAENTIVRSAPRANAAVLARVGPDRQVVIFSERDGWFEIVVRGEWRIIGWIRQQDLQATDEPPPTPPPATDS